jgi:hypothetical protein
MIRFAIAILGILAKGIRVNKYRNTALAVQNLSNACWNQTSIRARKLKVSSNGISPTKLSKTNLIIFVI